MIYLWKFQRVEILILAPENVLPPPLDPISVPSLRPRNLSDESEQFGGVRKSVHGTHLQWWANQNKNIKKEETHSETKPILWIPQRNGLCGCWKTPMRLFRHWDMLKQSFWILSYQKIVIIELTCSSGGMQRRNDKIRVVRVILILRLCLEILEY